MGFTAVAGCSLSQGDGASPQVYTAIANINSFSGPSGSRSVIDVTTLSDSAKAKDVGIAEMGQLTFNFHFDAADTELVDVWDNFLAGTLHNFKLEFSDGTKFTFNAYILSFNFDGSTDDVVRGSATLEIDGTIVDTLS